MNTSTPSEVMEWQSASAAAIVRLTISDVPGLLIWANPNGRYPLDIPSSSKTRKGCRCLFHVASRHNPWSFLPLPCSGEKMATPSLNKTRLVRVVQGISPFLGFSLRPEHKRPAVNDDDPRRTIGCRGSKTACHRSALVHRVPNNPLFVLLPDFVSHRNPRFST